MHEMGEKMRPRDGVNYKRKQKLVGLVRGIVFLYILDFSVNNIEWCMSFITILGEDIKQYMSRSTPEQVLHESRV